ncbi:Lrp/AsnC family transcriptional regulator [Leifsonia sp. AG29]|uniref:Lrp/AsnC family transcriptional regulator n=1 Tax=Leifsonia sp. AG29 TaxID=2598860 RepID=UPI00131B0D49|nr:Lrp/AsnC family transcriptional regulator [Leifsonia sp. AG29]
MDSIDDKILALLRTNARCSFTQLGHLVGLSVNATASRVRRLEETGIILGYTLMTGAVAAPRDGIEVFIDVRLAPATDYREFTQAVKKIPEIVETIHVTGPYDYLLRAHTPNTRNLDLLLRRLKRDCGVAQSQTRIALRSD